MRYAALFVLILIPTIAGCPSLTMTPEQLKASDGMITCSQLSSMYGKGSSITANPDRVTKGATSKGKTAITCGDATLVIEQDVGVPAKPVP